MPDMQNAKTAIEDLGRVTTPDLASQDDIFKLRKGQQFYARFVSDPNGDSVRWAKDHIDALRKGMMSRHGISKSYWESGAFLERPPLAEYLGAGKFKVIE